MKLPQGPQSVRETRLNQPETLDEFPFEDLETSISERFERIVRLYPDRVAVKKGGNSLSYDELNKSANRIARAILNCTGPSKGPIGLLFDHGVDVIAAILGVLKSGNYYIALDPTAPAERLRYILQDSGTALLVTDNQSAHVSDVHLMSGVTVLSLDQVDRALPTTNPGVSVSPADTASVCYTSGSTGQPKGVIETHRFRLYGTTIHSNSVGIRTDDRVTLLHSVAFATAQTNLTRALLHGASLFPFAVKSDGLHRLARWLREEGITICHMSVGVFRQFAEILSTDEDFPSLRIIHLSGAPISRSDFEVFKSKFPSHTAFAFHMGATEAGPICAAVVDREFNYPDGGVPAGYRLPGKSIFLVDDQGRTISDNELGEIAVRSRYLAAGYWNQPELTGVRFLPDRDDSDQRIYLTGDMGSFTPQGLLVHWGRKDLLVKIRGFRIELGEIERALQAHTAVREVGVAAWDGKLSGEKFLVAYIVPRGDSEILVDELRDFLGSKLPDYMIPTSFVFLEWLPLTNGKLDRGRLPKPDDTRPKLRIAYTPPGNDTERILARIWEEVLGLRTIGIHDHFFDLGGNSLLAIKLFGQIEKIFGKPLVPAVLFEFPTVAQLAGLLAQDGLEASLSSLVSVKPSGSKPPLFWIHGDSSYADLPAYLADDQPLFGLDHQSQDGKPCRYTTVESIAAHYLGLIRKVQTRGPYWLGGYSFGGTIAFEIAQQLKQQGDEVALLFLLDPSFPGLVPLSASDSSGSIESMDMSSLVGQLKDRWWKIRQGTLPDILAFVAERLRAGANSLRYWVWKVLKLVICRSCIVSGQLIPRPLRSFYILNVYDQARRVYRPRPFAGRATYCKSSARSDEHLQNWAKLIIDGIEVFEVPGDHAGVIRPPVVGIWANKLNANLNDALSRLQSQNNYHK